MEPHIFLGLSHIFISFVICILSIPLIKGKVPMNDLYGIRTAKAMESDENWYKINKYGARQLMIWSVPLALIGIVLIFTPIKNDFVYIVLACAPLLYIIPAVKCYIHGKKVYKT